MDAKSKWNNPANFDIKFYCGAMLIACEKVIEGDEGAVEKLKDLLIKFCSEIPEEFLALTFFNGIRSENIFRWPDELWSESMRDPKTTKVEYDTQAAISNRLGGYDNVDLAVRWSFPDSESIRLCKDNNKLIFLAMAICEEIIHISQFESPTSRRFASIGTVMDLSQLEDISEGDKEKLNRLMELDVYILFEILFPKKLFENHQWYSSRQSTDSSDAHHPGTLEELFTILFDLTKKYSGDRQWAALMFQLMDESIRKELGIFIPNLQESLRSAINRQLEVNE